mmetsp:Transcript_59113/g.135558  ORF Transcript_59113/g.135558 Transcript_59113/m.135558 type:complete len:227 (-) Transcript_59113:324-1004(-)
MGTQARSTTWEAPSRHLLGSASCRSAAPVFSHSLTASNCCCQCSTFLTSCASSVCVVAVELSASEAFPPSCRTCCRSSSTCARSSPICTRSAAFSSLKSARIDLEAEAAFCSWSRSWSRSFSSRKRRFWFVDWNSRSDRSSSVHLRCAASCAARTSSATTWNPIDAARQSARARSSCCSNLAVYSLSSSERMESNTRSSSTSSAQILNTTWPLLLLNSSAGVAHRK